MCRFSHPHTHRESSLRALSISLSFSAAAEQVCGSDGVTYADQCQLRTIACRQDKDTVVRHFGQCTGEPRRTLHASPLTRMSELMGRARRPRSSCGLIFKALLATNRLKVVFMSERTCFMTRVKLVLGSGPDLLPAVLSERFDVPVAWSDTFFFFCKERKSETLADARALKLPKKAPPLLCWELAPSFRKAPKWQKVLIPLQLHACQQRRAGAGRGHV